MAAISSCTHLCLKTGKPFPAHTVGGEIFPTKTPSSDGSVFRTANLKEGAVTHWRCLCSGRAICGGTLTKRSLSSSPTGLLVSPRTFSSCSVTLGAALFSQRSKRSSFTSSTHCTSCRQVSLQFSDGTLVSVARTDEYVREGTCGDREKKTTI